MRVEDIRQKFIRKLETNDIADDGNIELLGVSFIADESAIFGTVNEAYIKREIDWYLSMSRNVYDIEEPIPAIWKHVSDVDGNINSNYGWCVFSEENHKQYSSVVDCLLSNKNSRQANMIYTRPTMHTDASKNGAKDFMCTNNVLAIIRDDKLHFIVNMRSNDVIYGYKNDYAWQRYVQSLMVLSLTSKYQNLEVGDIHWQVGSLHVYPKHFHLIGE